MRCVCIVELYVSQQYKKLWALQKKLFFMENYEAGKNQTSSCKVSDIFV